MLGRVLSAALIALTVPLCAQQVIQHAPDGSSRIHIDSIDIPTVPNAPFSATVVTQITRILPDGSKQTNWNHRLVARDSSGRVFQERRAFTPEGNVKTTLLTQLQYDDPNTHERTLCNPFNKVCNVYVVNYTTELPSQNASLPALTTLPNGVTIQREDLGHNTVQGFDCLGSRQIDTIPAGLRGNETSQPEVREFWYSPQLGINLITKRFDPFVSSTQNFTVTQLTPSEPDPKNFTPPDGYTLVRVRER